MSWITVCRCTILAAAMLIPWMGVQSAVLTVTSGGNAGSGSLRQAVLDASNDDVIQFSSSLSSITLSSNIEIDKNITIDGPGADELAISGGNSAQIFHVSAAGTVEINGLTLENGRGGEESFASGGFTFQGGGAIYMDGSGTLNIFDCEFVDNNSQSGDGALSFDYGGAIFYAGSGTSTISRCLFSGNSISTSSGISGGAVHLFEDADVTIINSTFTDNTSPNEGGGIVIDAFPGGSTPSLEVVNCTFFSNNASGASFGGDIHALGNGKTVILHNNIFNHGGAPTTLSVDINGSGTALSRGGNIFRDTPGGLTTIVSDDVAGGNTSAGLTGSLVINGGGTRSIAISGSGSLATGFGTTGFNEPALDQRGHIRDGDIDAGAHEHEAPFVVVNLAPEDDASGVPATTNLVVTFDHNVTVSTGSVTIRRSSDDALLQSVGIADITGSGTKNITIDPPATLPGGVEMYVNIPSSLFVGPTLSTFAGISNTSDWSFTTAVAPEPDRLAFSSVGPGGVDGVPAVVNMTAQSVAFVVTAGTFSAAGSAVPTTATVVGTIFVDIGGGPVTAGSIIFSPTGAVESTIATVSYSAEVPTTASISLSVPGNVMAATTASFLLNQPPASIIAISGTSSSGVDGFNGGNLNVSNQQIFNFNFATFNDLGNLSATSASTFVNPFDRVTLRLVDSPFPSNPANKPTIVGVGGVWAAGPSVSSTHATVFLSSTAAIRSGVLQMAWLGQTPTTITLRIDAGDFSIPGTLVSTEITITVFPSAPTQMAFSNVSPGGTDGVPAVVNMQNQTVAIPISASTFSATGQLSATTASIIGTITVDVGGGPVTAGSISFSTNAASESTTINVSYVGEAPTTATISLSVPGDVMTATTASFLLNQAPASTIAFSSLSTGGVDGFNGGNLSVQSQQIFNLNFATFNDLGNLSATSASSFVDPFDRVTLRLVGSPFPSNPAVKPTIIGVGGVWAAGSSVSSTHATVFLSSTAAIRTGVLQMAWLGASPTTITLRIDAGGFSTPGSLISTSITVTVFPVPATALAFSTTSQNSNDGWNADDASGFGNRFIVQALANAQRETANITMTTASFNAADTRTAVFETTQTELIPFTGFGGNSATGTSVPPFPVYVTSASLTSNQIRIGMRDRFARGMNLTLQTTAGQTLSSTTLSLTVLIPAASQLGFSTTFGNVSGAPGAGIGTDGFNGGNLTLGPTSTVTVTIASFDAANYIAATGNNTFPIFFFTTTLTASVNNPQVSLSGPGTTLTLSPISALQSGALTITYTGSTVTTVTITYAHSGDNSMGSTSVNVTLQPLPAVALAFSANSQNSNDGWNASDASGFGNRFIVQALANAQRETANITMTTASFNAADVRKAVSETTQTELIPFTGFGGNSATGTSVPPFPVYVTSASLTSNQVRIGMRDRFARGMNLTLQTTAGQTLSSTTLTLTVLIPAASQLGFSTTFGNVGGAPGAGIGTDGFNGGNLTLALSPTTTPTTTVPVTIASFDAANYIAATGNNTFPIFFFTTTLTASVDNPDVTLSGAGTTLTLSPIQADDNDSLTITYTGATITTVTISYTHSGDNAMGSTSVNVTLIPPQPVALAFSDNDQNAIDGFNGGNTTIVLPGTTTTATVIVTSGTFNPLGQLAATQSSITALFVQTIIGEPQKIIGSAEFGPGNATSTASITLEYSGLTSTTAIVTLQAPGFVLQSTSLAVTIIKPSPVLLEFSPTIGTVGTEVTITGANFSGAQNVEFNGVTSASFVVDSDSQIRAIVPTSATTGPITIISTAGTGTSSEDFTVITTITLSVIDDARVNSDTPNQNYGNGNRLRVKFIDRDKFIYLKFDVTGISTTIQSVTLRMKSTVNRDDGGSVFQVSNNFASSAIPWVEGSLTFDNAPPISGSALDNAGAISNGQFVEWDVASAVSGNGVISFGLLTTDNKNVNYRSKESTDDPELVVVTDSQTLTFIPTNDAWVNARYPTQNNGNAKALTTIGDSLRVNSYLKFNTASVTGTVFSASLRLRVTNASDDGGTIYSVSDNFKGTSDPWTEGALNFNNAPEISGTALDAVGAVSNGQDVEFDVSGGIDTDGISSFGILNSSLDRAGYKSSEASSDRPELIITFAATAAPKQSVPETPAASRPFQTSQSIVSAVKPNPFEAQVTLEYRLPGAARVRIEVYSAQGARIAVLYDDYRSAGGGNIVWNGNDAAGTPMANGLYYMRIQAGAHVEIAPVALQR